MCVPLCKPVQLEGTIMLDSGWVCCISDSGLFTSDGEKFSQIQGRMLVKQLFLP